MTTACSKRLNQAASSASSRSIGALARNRAPNAMSPSSRERLSAGRVKFSRVRIRNTATAPVRYSAAQMSTDQSPPSSPTSRPARPGAATWVSELTTSSLLLAATRRPGPTRAGTYTGYVTSASAVNAPATNAIALSAQTPVPPATATSGTTSSTAPRTTFDTSRFGRRAWLSSQAPASRVSRKIGTVWAAFSTPTSAAEASKDTTATSGSTIATHFVAVWVSAWLSQTLPNSAGRPPVTTGPPLVRCRSRGPARPARRCARPWRIRRCRW